MDGSGDPWIVAVADSSSSDCFLSVDRDVAGLVRKHFDQEVSRLSFLSVLKCKGDEIMGGGSKKGIAETARDVECRDGEERER